MSLERKIRICESAQVCGWTEDRDGSTDLRESRVELQDGVEVVESLRCSTDGEIGCSSLVVSDIVGIVLCLESRCEGM